MTRIHPTAIVDGRASLCADVEIGPYCVVGPDVELADGVRLMSHVVIEGHTCVGEESIVHPFANIGARRSTQPIRANRPSSRSARATSFASR